jgi:predicted secreted Zn-dependent protease
LIKILDEGAAVRLDGRALVACRREMSNGRDRQGCPLSPSTFNIYVKTCICQWNKYLAVSSEVQVMILNTFLFADDQDLLAHEENNAKIPFQRLNNTVTIHNDEQDLHPLINKVMAYRPSNQVRGMVAIVVGNITIE